MGARLELSVTPAPRALDVRTPRLAKIRANRDLIRRAARRHHATNLQVFGSVARGEDGPDSDIDLLVDLDVHTHGLMPALELTDELTRLLGEKVDDARRAADILEAIGAIALGEATKAMSTTTTDAYPDVP